MRINITFKYTFLIYLLTCLILLPSKSYGHAPAGTTQEVQGEINTLVILTKPAAEADPVTFTQVERNYFGTFSSVSDYTRTNSYGKAWMKGDVVKEWISMTELEHAIQYSQVLPWEKIFDRVEVAMRRQLNNPAYALDIEKYKLIAFIHPHIGPTIFHITQFRGRTLAAPIQGVFVWPSLTNGNSVLHEIYHQLGRKGESSAWICSGYVPISNNLNCVQRLYGDEYNVLGGGKGHLNAVQKESMGWLKISADPVQNSGTLVTQSGRYTIKPMTSKTGIRYLKIPYARDSQSNPSMFYYVEYRVPMDYDQYLPLFGSPKSPFNGVLVHLGPFGSSKDGLLLDMHPTNRLPGGGSLSTGEIWDQSPDPLYKGEEFKDPTTGVSFKLVDINNETATIDVTLTPMPANQPPSLRFLNLKPNQEVIGTVVFDVEAFDDIGIKDISVYRKDDGSVVSGVRRRFPGGQSDYVEIFTRYSWNTSSLSDGPYTLVAVVTDRANLKSQTEVSVVVKNNSILAATASTTRINFTEPAASTVITGATRLRAGITGNLTSTDLMKISVFFEVSPASGGSYQLISEVLRNSNTNSYEISWFRKDYWGNDAYPIVPNGDYVLRAKAVDRSGYIIYSPILPVKINVPGNTATPLTDPTSTPFSRGDVNNDGVVNITDPMTIINYLNLGIIKSVDCIDAADANDDGSLNISDAQHLLNYLYLGGPPPKDPFNSCAADPTPDPLTCNAFPSCSQ